MIFQRKEKLPPAFLAIFSNGEHRVEIQGRFPAKVVEAEMRQRFSQAFPDRKDWQLVGITQVKPATKRKRV